MNTDWRDPRIKGWAWAAGDAMFLVDREIGRCNAKPPEHPDYDVLYTTPDRGENCPFWEKFDLDWKLSEEEKIKAGPMDAERIEEACKNLTCSFGRQKSPPPFLLHKIDYRFGELIEEKFFWDGHRYRFLGYENTMLTGRTDED